jgi:hypothetical protein
LGKKSLLVRGFDGDDLDGTFPEMRPDLRSHTIWDTIRNTIEDPAMTLYLVLDEAHRGMGTENGEKSTIVKRLINGKRACRAFPWCGAFQPRWSGSTNGNGGARRDAALCRPLLWTPRACKILAC